MSNRGSLLIVGGSGFIGKSLAKEAVKKDYSITVISLNEVEKENQIKNIKYLHCDLRDYEKLKLILKNLKITHVVNLSGYIDHSKFKMGGKEVIDTHLIGIENLIKVLNWDELKSFVQIGSSDEYGNIKAPQEEKTLCQPISSYSLAKLAIGQLLLMLNKTEGFPAVVIRLFLVYGPGQKKDRFLPQIIKGCLENNDFPASSGEQIRDFCYVEDIAKGILVALETKQACGEVINLASGQPIKIKDVLEKVVGIIGSGNPCYGEIPLRNDENMSLYADISKAKKILNWQPSVAIDEGLLNTIMYFRDGSNTNSNRT